MKIVTLTLNPALDKSSTAPHMKPDSKLRCSELRMDAGGGGINVSKGVKKLGGRTTAVFPIGGNNGDVLKSLVTEADVFTKTIKIDGETRENLSIIDESTGQQYRFTMPGASLTPEKAAACLDMIASLKADIVVASGSLPPGLPVTYYKEVAAFCSKIGAKFVLDTSGAPLQAAAEEGVFLLKPNLGELSALAGVERLEMNMVDDAARDIIGQGKCEVVIVSLGPGGAVLVTKDRLEHVPAPTVMKRTTVGAGDSMVAGMVWALGRKKGYSEMIRMGVACGTAATMNEGTNLFNTEDVWRLMDWIKSYGKRQQFTDF